jgi:SAM-dependent methyltransferase
LNWVPLRRAVQRLRFSGSIAYWERRYSRGGTSGAGSYGEQAAHKAAFLNEFVDRHAIQSVIEFGCGDGNQLSLASYPRYLGLDVSATAIEQCLERFAADPTKSFIAYTPRLLSDPARFIRADLALSLDVIYHLVEDLVYDDYMRRLFGAADRFVVIYATDTSGRRSAPHVRHRSFSEWVTANAPWWSVDEVRIRPRDAYQDFYVFRAEDDGLAHNELSPESRAP